MRIFNAKVYIDGHFQDGGIEFDDKFIKAGPDICDGDLDAGGQYIIPGLVDIHTHGILGFDASYPTNESLEKAAIAYAKKGVTSYCPTLMSLKEDDLLSALEVYAEYKPSNIGANIAGINMEGPFLSPDKKGSQSLENLGFPDINLFLRAVEASKNQICLVTIAPELPLAQDFIKDASKYAKVAIGHTKADYGTAMKAFSMGASHITHLFNAMEPLHHRNPGLLPAALDSGASAELICDGFHIAPPVVRLSFKLLGRNICLISDSLPCTGLPFGEYELCGEKIINAGGVAMIKESDTLAGSCISLFEALKRAISFGISIEDAIYSASLAPAKAINKDSLIGSINPGKYADFLIVSSDFTLKEVFARGKSIQ